jgi:septal ring factor EnvC (AmiA/AmiB activator)
MSTTVKVFIVLNLLLALAFMFVQMTLYATRENWKRRWNDDTKFFAEEVKVAAQKIADESYAKVQAQALVSSQGSQISDLQANLKKQENALSEKDKQIQSLNLTISKNDEEIKALREQNQTLSNTLELTRQSNNEKTHIAQVARAVAFQLNVKLAEVEDDYNNATTALAQREEELTKAKKVNNQQNAQLAILKDRYPKIYNELGDQTASAAFLQAVVAAVRNNPQGQQDLVMLTLGKGDKVDEGVEFIIFRGNSYIVRVRAEKVLGDMVACRVIPDSWNSNQLQIQQGDLAQNRL